MPAKKTETGKPYRVDGKKFYWSPLDEDDQRGNLADVMIPLRIKLALLLDMQDEGVEMDAAGMAKMLKSLIPNQEAALREMDINDFQEMFTAWQTEYNTLTGSSLGE